MFLSIVHFGQECMQIVIMRLFKITSLTSLVLFDSVNYCTGLFCVMYLTLNLFLDHCFMLRRMKGLPKLNFFRRCRDPRPGPLFVLLKRRREQHLVLTRSIISGRVSSTNQPQFLIVFRSWTNWQLGPKSFYFINTQTM